MARPKLYTESMIVRFDDGTLAAIDSVVCEGETRTDVIRMAVRREVARRRRLAETASKSIKPG